MTDEAQDELMDVLKSIDDSGKAILAYLKGQATRVPPAGAIASDKELSGKYGDPIVTAKDPRDWTGEPMKGRKFSQCPADYLDLLAERYDYFAKKNDENGEKLDDGRPKSEFARRDAARARGWALRLRNGYKAAPVSEGWASERDGDF